VKRKRYEPLVSGDILTLQVPNSRRSPRAAPGRDLPDADSTGFVSLNGAFGETNQSLIAQERATEALKCFP